MIICASICQGTKASQKEFGICDGVTAIIPFLGFDSPDAAEKENVLLCTIECIWGTVCGDLKHEDEFFEKEGIFQLLDLLETNSNKTRLHVIGCVLDLLENPKCIYLALQWRTQSDVKKGIAHLLLKLWEEDEQRLAKGKAKSMAGSDRGKDGLVITGLQTNIFVF